MQVAWVYGVPGVGKSTTAGAVFSSLCQHSTTASLDLRQLGFLGDPDAATHHELQAANIATLWGCFHAIYTSAVASGISMSESTESSSATVPLRPRAFAVYIASSARATTGRRPSPTMAMPAE
jgi:adenylylsulfate kinase-like enzyme